MPTFSSDGVDIHYEVAGEGYPLVWGHEFAGDTTRYQCSLSCEIHEDPLSGQLIYISNGARRYKRKVQPPSPETFPNFSRSVRGCTLIPPSLRFMSPVSTLPGPTS